MFMYELDPYLVCDAFEYEETPEDFAARASEDATTENVQIEINELRGLLTENDKEAVAKLDGFEKRIQALKAA